jgi:Secretion system C-terminal sorting domain
MKYLAAMFLLLLLIFSNENLQAQWVKINLPNKAIAIAAGGTNVYTCTDSGGVYLSTNNGTDWTPANNGLPTLICDNIFTSGSTIYVSSIGDVHTIDGLFQSTNNGTNWSYMFDVNYVTSILFKGNYFFVNARNATFSHDNFNSFTITDIMFNDTVAKVPAIALFGNKFYAATLGVGIFEVSDDGLNWDSRNTGLTNHWVYSLAVSDNNFFAGTAKGVFLSNDGIFWKQINNGIPPFFTINSIVVKGSTVFAGQSSSMSGGGVYVSADTGKSWTQVNGGLTFNEDAKLVINESNIFVCIDHDYNNVWTRPLSEITGTTKESNNLPKDFALFQNYPNPFNPSTAISYSIPTSSNVRLIVYNTLGQTVKVLENGFKIAGNYSINFNASDLPSGIFFYKLEAGQFSQVKKMILVK